MWSAYGFLYVQNISGPPILKVCKEYRYIQNVPNNNSGILNRAVFAVEKLWPLFFSVDLVLVDVGGENLIFDSY